MPPTFSLRAIGDRRFYSRRRRTAFSARAISPHAVVMPHDTYRPRSRLSAAVPASCLALVISALRTFRTSQVIAAAIITRHAPPLLR